MRGFVADVGIGEERKEFVDSYRTIWLYGSSDVLKWVIKFLKIMLDERREEYEGEVEKCLKGAVMAMRKDLMAKGKLTAKDFDIFV